MYIKVLSKSGGDNNYEQFSKRLGKLSYIV